MKKLKKRINLFTPDLLPPKLQLSFERLLKGAVICIALSSLLMLYTVYDNQSLKSKLNNLSANKTELEQQKSNLEQNLAQRKPNPSLVAELELSSKRLQIKQLLQTELNRRTTVNSVGFSPLLQDLANVSMTDLWLSQISVKHEQLNFEGYSLNADLVPLWVNKLKTTNTFNGYTFASMTMSRGDNGPIAFNLSSQEPSSTSEKIQ